MKVHSNPHTHTTFCDGRSTPQEQVLSALHKGFTTLGFSGHALTSFDLSCCMTLEKYPEYLRQLRRLRQQYWGQMNIVIGLEQDSAQLVQAEDFGLPAGTPKEEWPIQYRIASVHCIPSSAGGLPYVIDSTQEDVARCCDEAFGGDGLSMAKGFFKEAVRNAWEGQGDILGHFDLIRKLNNGRFFDEESEEYQKIALDALEAAAEAGVPFEVNTSGFRYGAQNQPYPAIFLLKRLAEKKIPVILSSDCHLASQLDFQFERTEELLRELGFDSVLELDGGAHLFKETSLR